jgi:hypothetical protein
LAKLRKRSNAKTQSGNGSQPEPGVKEEEPEAAETQEAEKVEAASTGSKET